MHTDPLDLSAGDPAPREVRPFRRTVSAPARSDSGAIDWTGWLRLIERKRRLLSRMGNATPELTGTAVTVPTRPVARAARAQPDVVALTYSSFKLDGWDVTPQQVRSALAPSSAGRSTPELRSRQAQRLRNHASILHHVESSLRVGEPLKSHVVVRWFTHVSSGLTTRALDDDVMARLDQIVRKINSPQLRLQPALTEISALHANLLADPLMPSYNGILSRLLLRYHLGRCSLPPIVFDPMVDAPSMQNAEDLLRTMLKRIEESYAKLLG